MNSQNPENPVDQVKLTDIFALEPLEIYKDKEKLRAIIDYQRGKRRVFVEDQKGKGRVKKEKPIAEVMEKKL